MLRNWIISALVAIIAAGGALAALGVTQEVTTDVEIRVWQRISDGSLYLSTRPDGGRWTTHNNALDMSAVSPSGNFRQSSFVTIEVPVFVDLPEEPAPETTPDASPGSTLGPSPQPTPEGAGETTAGGPYEGSGSGYATERDASGSVTTYIYTPPDADFRSPGAAGTALIVRCLKGQLQTYLSGGDLPTGNPGGGVGLAWSFDDDPWEPDGGVFGEELGTVLVDIPVTVTSGGTLNINIDGPLYLTFDLTNMFNSPVQWNIDNCGAY